MENLVKPITVKDVKRPSSTRVKLTIQIGADRIRSCEQSVISHLSRSEKINGFRPGKIPNQVIKSKFKDKIQYEVTSQLLEQGVSTALEEQKLSPISRPKVGFRPGPMFLPRGPQKRPLLRVVHEAPAVLQPGSRPVRNRHRVSERLMW